jgi:hypothetical protein
MQAKNSGRSRRRQDFPSRWAAAKTDEERTALVKAATFEELRAAVESIPLKDRHRFLAGPPDRRALLEAKGIAFRHATIIKAATTKHGARMEWGQRQFAQAAIAALYPAGIPKHLNHSSLHRDVAAWLSTNPDYRAAPRGPLTRPTVLRALRDLREDNPD